MECSTKFGLAGTRPSASGLLPPTLLPQGRRPGCLEPVRHLPKARRLPRKSPMELFATNRGDADPVAVGGHRVMQQVRDHAVFLLDRRGRAASWNEGVRHIFGWDEHDWLGQPLHVIFTPEDVAANAPALELQQASDSGRADDTRWMLRKN